MKDLKQQPSHADIRLDELVTRVESAAQMIANLQADIRLQSARIRELEQVEAALRKDADWAGWFRRKYSNSTFYSAVEKEYFYDHRDKDEG
jgi:hypothetical protein